jgi:hypothetical protein
MLERRRAQHHPATGPQPLRPLGERLAVVLDVLDHLERAHQIELLVVGKHGQVAVVHLSPAAGRLQPGLCDLVRDLVQLDGRVGRIAGREPGGETALAAADLEDVAGAGRKQPGHQVPAHPGVRAERGQGHDDSSGFVAGDFVD